RVRQSILRESAQHRAEGNGSVGRADRPQISPVPLRRPPASRARRVHHRLRRRSARGNGRLAVGECGGEGWGAAGCAVSAVGRRRISCRHAQEREGSRRAGSHQGNWGTGRAPFFRRDLDLCPSHDGREACDNADDHRRPLRSLVQGFRPSMVKAVFDELKKPEPKHGFTVGITDDVSNTSLPVDHSFDIETADTIRALFYGLGADGTVGANKNSTKILASEPGRYAQGYFVYDSKKSGSYTISHLRFGPKPIHAPYLIKSASFIGVHKFDYLFKIDMLAAAAQGSTVLLNSPFGLDEVWNELPREGEKQIIVKRLKLHVIDASKVALSLCLGSRTNTILQTCFFALSGVMPRAEAIAAIKKATEKTYARK